MYNEEYLCQPLISIYVLPFRNSFIKSSLQSDENPLLFEPGDFLVGRLKFWI